jgi:hypothetical protein
LQLPDEHRRREVLEDLREEFLAHREARNLSKTVEWYTLLDRSCHWVP